MHSNVYMHKGINKNTPTISRGTSSQGLCQALCWVAGDCKSFETLVLPACLCDTPMNPEGTHKAKLSQAVLEDNRSPGYCVANVVS